MAAFLWIGATLLTGCSFTQAAPPALEPATIQPVIQLPTPWGTLADGGPTAAAPTFEPTRLPDIEEPLSNERLEVGFQIVSFRLDRTANGYAVEPGFAPMLVAPDRAAQVYRQIEDEQQTPMFFRFETLDGNGNRETYFSPGTYCPEGTDVCQSTTDVDFPMDSTGYLQPLVIEIRPEIIRMEAFAGDQSIWSLQRPNQGPEFLSLSSTPTKAQVNDELVSGQEIHWIADPGGTGQAWVMVEYQASPDTWQAYTFGVPTLEGDVFMHPESVHAMLDDVDLRVTLTDGFTIQMVILEDVLHLVKGEIELTVYGLHASEYVVGQNIVLWLGFIDPETGLGCVGSGCLEGENQGKYEVTWHSSMQTICPQDTASGELTYVFKVEGTHRLGVTVQHIEKPDLRGEWFVDVVARLGPTAEGDPHPVCDP